MPGTIIAQARVNRPSIMIYGGTIRPGHATLAASAGAPMDIVSAFQSFGAYSAGLIDEPTREDIVRHSCPGPGGWAGGVGGWGAQGGGG